MAVMKVMRVMQAQCAVSQRRLLPAFITFVTCITSITSAAAADDRPFAAPHVAAGAATSTAGGLTQVTVSLVLVLGAVFAAAWLVKKLRGFGRFGAGQIEIVAEVALGTKERAVLVQVGGQQLLLGVATGRVNLLHTLAEPVPVKTDRRSEDSGMTGDSSPRAPDFKAILKRSLGLK
jgi:flagellar protein FliO/FliZ